MKRFGYAAAAVGLLAAIVGGYLWFRSPEQPSPVRVPLAQVKQRSQIYLARHAQSALTCPAGSTNCLVCNMQDAAGNLACQDHTGGTVSMTANGTPSYQLHTPIPKSDGFTHDAVGFNGTDAYFQAPNNAVADQTTNDFSVSGWLYLHPQAATGAGSTDRWFSKRAGIGFESYFVSGTLYANLQDASGLSEAAVVNAADFPAGTWHYVTLSYDRDGSVTAHMDGVTRLSGVISARQGSLSVASPLYLGNEVGGKLLYGGMAGFVISNGLTSLAEHQAMYRAFKVPVAGDVGVVGSPSYTQTTTWKWPLPPDASGARLGTYGPGQWPVAYASTLVDATENPLGLGFPGHGAVTNVIGYPNEFNSWTTGGAAPTVTTNALEAPDGSMTAETVRLPAIDSRIYKAVVGGGTVAAGETWQASVYYKFVSGAAGCQLRFFSSSASVDSITLSTSDSQVTTWTKFSLPARTAAVAKAIYLWNQSNADCTWAFSDASYHQNNLPVGSCTACTGAVNCVCNASYPTGNWDARASYMPAALERGELELTAAVAPQTSEAGIRRHLAHLGDWAYLAEGIQPAFVKRNHGGMPSTVGKGKPLQIVEEKRKYVGSWDYRNGLTNTSPRKTAALSLSINGGAETYQHSPSEGRYVTASVDASNPARQTDLNARNWSLGCNLLGNNCADAVIQDFTFWSRPEQKVRSDDSTLVAAVDFTGSAWLSHASVPRLSCPSGVDTANCWVWDMGELGGDGIYDRINGVKLTATGTPTYQVNSGLLVRGQGRRGWNIYNTEYVEGSSVSVATIPTNALQLSWGAIMTSNTANTTNTHVFGPGSYVVPANRGWGINLAGLVTPQCVIVDGTERRYQNAGANIDTNAHVVECHTSRASAADPWEYPDLYVDGVLRNGGTGSSGTGNVVNLSPYLNPVTFMRGIAYAAGSGVVYEGWVATTTDGAAGALARYKQTVQQGTYWTDDANTVAHYKFNERTVTNGIGLRDHSGNGNHLTVVNGTPDPQYRPMPWPAGSGVTKPAVQRSNDTNSWAAAAGAVAAPEAAQPYSACALFRMSGTTATTPDLLRVGIGGASQGASLTVASATGFPTWNWRTSTAANSRAGSASDLRNGRWHLFCGRTTWDGDSWVLGTSVDGTAFATTDSADAGTVTGNDGSVTVCAGSASISQECAGAGTWRSYALTDADVAAMWSWTSGPYDDLTYARTSTYAKGLCYDTAVDAINGVRTTCFGNNQVPFAYDSTSCNFPGNLLMCLGEPVHSAVANLALQSEDVATTWVNNNTSEVANSALAPDGTMTADTVTATAASGDLRQVFAAITAASHTYCQYLKRNGTADVAGFIRLVTESTGVAIASTAFTATSAWQKFCVSGTATLNDTRIVTEITTNGQSVFWWGAQLTATASNPGPYCPTNNASQTCNAPTSNYVAAANLASWDRSEGVIVASSTPYVGSTNYLWSLYNGATNNGRIRWVNPISAPRDFDIWNSTGVLQQDVDGVNGSPYLTGMVAIWDSQVAFYGVRRAYVSQFSPAYLGPWVTYSTDTGANWTTGTGTNLYLGNENAAGLIQGNFYEIYIWNDR